MTLSLSDADRRMLDGGEGDAVRLAMEFVVL
jgi:predicted aconitase